MDSEEERGHDRQKAGKNNYQKPEVRTVRDKTERGGGRGWDEKELTDSLLPAGPKPGQAPGTLPTAWEQMRGEDA